MVKGVALLVSPYHTLDILMKAVVYRCCYIATSSIVIGQVLICISGSSLRSHYLDARWFLRFFSNFILIPVVVLGLSGINIAYA